MKHCRSHPLPIKWTNRLSGLRRKVAASFLLFISFRVLINFHTIWLNHCWSEFNFYFQIYSSIWQASFHYFACLVSSFEKWELRMQFLQCNNKWATRHHSFRDLYGLLHREKRTAMTLGLLAFWFMWNSKWQKIPVLVSTSGGYLYPNYSCLIRFSVDRPIEWSVL
jgi:hypothetical protein